MESIGTVALWRETRGFLVLLQVFLAFTTICASVARAADASPACGNSVARVVSIQGIVEVQTAGQTTWTRVTRLDTSLCDGDRLRTGPASRSALFVQPESLVRLDRNTTVAVSQLPEETLIEFFQGDLRPAASNSCGAGYFISRFPRKLKVNTPNLSAAVEGTEFLVALNCATDQVSVFEGKVRVSQLADASASVLLQAGQTAAAGPGEAPALKLNIKPQDAVQWVVYYPPLTPPDARFEEDCRAVAGDQRAACLIARAERLLRAGHVDEANNQINDAIAIAPMNSDAKALQSIIHLVRNEKADALRVAQEAVDANPASAPAWLALSYAQQADFKFEAALTSAHKAIDFAPDNALALSRVAELQLSLGWNREAEETAVKAVAANDSEARAHMILGFIHLAQIKVKEARENFERAIELDSTEPLSRLGLGLAIIRKGKLQDGREQIEIAVALDPTNSLLRSYVGKAYYEENTKDRDQLAAEQFDLAKQLDPKDPTPWFYDAILNQVKNEPLQGLHDLQVSNDLNSNRSVYRSRMLVDQDNASRNANKGRIFRELGFFDLSLAESSNLLTTDPRNYSGHRLLADAYLSMPRHDIARQSELLQAQLRSPISLTPLQPQLTEDRLTILRSTGPGTPGLNEFTRLFERDGIGLIANGIVGSNDTQGDEVVFSTMFEKAAFSIAHLGYRTDGFRENNKLDKEATDGLIQVKLGTATTAQLEIRDSSTTQGDPFLRFDPDTFFTTTNDLTSTSGRVGLRYEISPDSDLLFSYIQARNSEKVHTEFGDISLPSTLYIGEFQYFRAFEYGNIQFGGGTNQEVREQNAFGFTSRKELDWANAYLYGTVVPTKQIAITIGASFDHYEQLNPDDSMGSEVNPKVGITLMPTDSTELSAAWFHTVKRKFFAGQTLEPTQVAGFNQFFDDPDQAKTKRVGLAIRQRILPTLFVGASLSSREIDFLQEDTTETFQWKERDNGAYLYFAPHEKFAFTISYSYTNFQRPLEYPGQELFLEARTEKVPLSFVFPSNTGWSLAITPTYVKQTGVFFPSPLGTSPAPGSSEFVITDLSVAYKLPRRHGQVAFQIRNAFNSSFLFQETEGNFVTFARDRAFYGVLSLNL